MKHRIFFVICVVSLLFFGYLTPAIPVAGDSPITAASGSAADIQAAANTVYAAGGGIVYIPEGDFNLNGSVLIREQVSLIGAGMGNTILRTQGSSMVIQAQGNNIRLSGFSLISTNYDGGNGVKINNCVDFRVDHLYIEGYSAEAGVYVRGIDTRGVIDHCEIKMKVVSDLGYGVVVYRDDFWEEDMKLGSAEATFIEDNVFVNARHAIAANSGAHYVFRHNLVKQGVVSHQVDAHGVGYGSTQGTRAAEVYENIVENPIHNPELPYDTEEAIGIRGGGGVIFNNTISGYKYAVLLTLESGQEGPYPVKDQVHDLWIWNNPHDGEGDEVIVAYGVSRDLIQENRDYFLYAKPSYTPYPYPHPLTLGGDNNPPLLNSIGNKPINEGQPLTFTVTATDPDGDILTYSASNLPPWASFTPATRTFSGTPDHSGNYTNVHFEVSDGLLTDFENITIYVNAIQPTGDHDVNSDGFVNVLDIIGITQHWGETGPNGWIPEDVNENGTIDVLDIILIGQYWTG